MEFKQRAGEGPEGQGGLALLPLWLPRGGPMEDAVEKGSKKDDRKNVVNHLDEGGDVLDVQHKAHEGRQDGDDRGDLTDPGHDQDSPRRF